MANIKSAKKRIKVIDRRNEENRFVRATISTHRKNFKKFLAEKDLVNAEKKFKETEKLVYSAVSKGIFHQNKADRIVARMSAELYYAANNTAPVVEATPAPAPVVEAPAPVVEEKKAPAKKTTVKKVATKTEEAPAKKTTAKKATTAKAETAPAKKTTAKKTVAKTEETPAKKTTTKKATTAKKETK